MGGVAGGGILPARPQSNHQALQPHRFSRTLPRPGTLPPPPGDPDAAAAAAALAELLPPVSLLKPLHGDEPMLEEALSSALQQDYPQLQVVFGVQHPDDPALAVVERLRARFPGRDVAVVVDGTPHGANRKIANLINMLPAARHDVLVISDSDIHVSPDYLRRVVGALHRPNIGLVTTLYGAWAATGTLARRLAAAQVNHAFLPGVLMSRRLGRQDCLGATMALRRSTLDSIGGLAALSPHVADDSALGKLVRATGRDIAIAETLTVTTVSDAGLPDLFGHELRWGRTVRSVEPVGYASSCLQLPLFWATLCVAFAPRHSLAWTVLLATWAVRGAAAARIDRIVASPARLPVTLLPARDWLSAAVMLCSFTGRRVAWRGHTLHLPPRAPATVRIPDLPRPEPVRARTAAGGG